MLFDQMNLCPQIKKAVAAQNYTEPSQIQQEAIPIVLDGRDLLGCAQTGSGKTAAFALPILQLLFDKYRNGNDHTVIRSLILTPTRELAIQIYDNFRSYGANLPLRTGVVVGGVNQRKQEIMLSKGVDILVATPGRLIDLVNQGLVHLDGVEIFVLDEADRMLDMGFLDTVKQIAAMLRTERQTLLFSATMPDKILSLIDTLLHDYAKVETAPVSSAAETIDQRVYFVDTKHKRELLLDILADENVSQALIFTRTKHGADALARELTKYGVECASIHGDKSQNARQNALKSFKEGKARILIATEIAARGIDIKELPYVFNYNIPEEAEMYIHRIGRTGRAGQEGKAISFCNYEEKPLLDEIEKLTGIEIPVAENLTYPMSDFTIRPKNQGRRRPQAGQNGNRQKKPGNRDITIEKRASDSAASGGRKSSSAGGKKPSGGIHYGGNGNSPAKSSKTGNDGKKKRYYGSTNGGKGRDKAYTKKG